MSTTLRPTITLSEKASAALTKRVSAHNDATGDTLSDSQLLSRHAEAMCEAWATDDHNAALAQMGQALRLVPEEDLAEIRALCEAKIAFIEARVSAIEP